MYIWFCVLYNLKNKKMENALSLSRKYSDLHNDYGIGYDDFCNEFLSMFYIEKNLPALYFENEFYKGDASNDDLVKLVDEINAKTSDDKPLVYLTICSDEEYDTNLFEFLDSLFFEELEDKLIEYKNDKRDEIFEILKELIEIGSDSVHFAKFYSTLSNLQDCIADANLDEDDEYYQSDLEATIANFIDYDSHLSKYFN